VCQALTAAPLRWQHVRETEQNTRALLPPRNHGAGTPAAYEEETQASITHTSLRGSNKPLLRASLQCQNMWWLRQLQQQCGERERRERSQQPGHAGGAGAAGGAGGWRWRCDGRGGWAHCARAAALGGVCDGLEFTSHAVPARAEVCVAWGWTDAGVSRSRGRGMGRRAVGSWRSREQRSPLVSAPTQPHTQPHTAAHSRTRGRRTATRVTHTPVGVGADAHGVWPCAARRRVAARPTDGDAGRCGGEGEASAAAGGRRQAAGGQAAQPGERGGALG
jgi:hypothetical protein